jgi:hypothetical protein
MILNMNKPTFENFLRKFSETILEMDLKTVSVSGHKGFTAWEWELNCVRKHSTDEGDNAGADENPANKTQTMRMKGVSLSWWNEAGKIVKMKDYARHV